MIKNFKKSFLDYVRKNLFRLFYLFILLTLIILVFNHHKAKESDKIEHTIFKNSERLIKKAASMDKF
ncbi:MAG: hypothetical protein B6D44_13865 [Ignavibacteriales bacterium UTCHB2]|jgi:hypothetical protein|nr:MAG: hypothetical protein BWY38_00903 [Ignavibacteria bacterium ADurb.Bin266]OQY71074.1 MAG: hypothetical protein B6D44_13865 [Ignavibacteriales bacterium UTCHB2]